MSRATELSDSAAALLGGRRVAPLLFGVSPLDPPVYAAVIATLFTIAVAACIVPAWRAARGDPSTALRAR